MLMSAGVTLPRQIVVHGWWNLEGKPLSKTTGNVLDPRDAVAEFGTDPVRYYLMREGSWFQDGNFARANLVQRYHAELANDLGNLLNRTVTMIGRYCDGLLPAGTASAAGEREAAVQRAAETALRDATAALDGWEFGRALDAIWRLVRRGNQYIDESQPWRLARDPAQRAALETVLATTAESLRFQAILLGPFMPATADRMLAQLGLDGISPGAWSDLRWQPDGSGRPVPGGSPLFPRLSA
jgi:methionyl-tRNA synthetase